MNYKIIYSKCREFELTKDEYNALKISSRSQFVTLNNKRGTNIKYTPLAFTEQGVRC
ncbi:MAG: ORF6N domain-containing protein [Bacteroidales bacterium]|nr:ORF6N domain-containing protein [Bacteroidales bacterium]